jgi:hypothetical protein
MKKRKKKGIGEEVMLKRPLAGRVAMGNQSGEAISSFLLREAQAFLSGRR